MLTIDEDKIYSTYNNREKMKNSLKKTRCYSKYLHAILTTKHSDSGIFGIIVQFYGEDTGEGWTHFECMRGATGQSSNNTQYAAENKNQTGVLVFLENIPTTFSSGWGWTRANAIAWTLSHEIGHALGLSDHCDQKSVMIAHPN